MALQRITLDLMLLWPLACVALTGLVLAYAAFFYGGVVPENWNVCLLAIGCITALYWMFSRKRDRAPRLEPLLLWPMILLPCYLAFELIPLPLSVLKALSPARAELLQALQPLFADANSAPLSVMPPAALAQWFRIIAYIAVFLLIRELTWRFLRMRWAIVVPLLIIGTLEAALGMIQCAADWGNAAAHGTYVDRDHFAGLLEMVLPLLGVTLPELLLYETISLPVILFHHSNLRLSNGADRCLRWLIVTPRMHYVHHSRWQPETDSNYTSLLSIWDRLFGSFRLRDQPAEISLGLDHYEEREWRRLPGMLAAPFRKSRPRDVSTPEAPQPKS